MKTSVSSRIARALRRDHRVVPSSRPAKEPCLGCGEETAAGSVFYSDRKVIERADGTRSILCSLCDARVRGARKERRATDAEVRAAVEHGSAAAYLWGNGR